jgi:DNA-binding FadR family transcriptional regulator
MKIEKLQLTPAYRAVSDDLRQRIVRGEIQPGDPLPIEADLAERYGVHRSTVREGLRHLETDGLVRRDGKKLLVTVPSQDDLARAAERALRMRQVTYRDVWELASTLEPLCAELAAQRITADELTALARNLQRTREVVEAGASPVHVTIEFQTLVAEATHNQAMVLAHGPVSLLMRAGYAAIAPALPQSGKRLLEAHSHVYEALVQRDVKAAVEWTRRHLEDHRRGCDVAGLDMSQPIPVVDGTA